MKKKVMRKPRQPSITVKLPCECAGSGQVGYAGKVGRSHALLLDPGAVASPGSLRGEPGCCQQGWCCGRIRPAAGDWADSVHTPSLPLIPWKARTCRKKERERERVRALLWIRLWLKGMLWLVWSPTQSTKTFSISAIRLFHFLIIRVFIGAALLISFKNFSFAFTTWLTIWCKKPSFLDCLSFWNAFLTKLNQIVTSKVADRRSYNNIVTMKTVEILRGLPKCDRDKCCWKNGTNRLAQHRVAADLQFVKK